VWVFLCLAGTASSTPPSGTPAAHISVDILRIPEADPGAFATWSYRLGNRSPRQAELDLRIDLPDGWRAVTPARTMSLQQADVQSMPFTVWIPPHAQADSAHVVQLRLLDRDELFPQLSYRHEILVRALPGVSVTSLDPELSGHPGRNTVARFLVMNTGNRSGQFELEATSVPNWQVAASPGKIRLAPGERREVVVRSRVPGSARSRTNQLISLSAIGDPDGAGEIRAQDRVRVTVMPDSRPSPSQTRLPLGASLSVGEQKPGGSNKGLRLTSSGRINPRTRFEMDVDLTTRTWDRQGAGWQSRRLSFGLSGEGFDLTLGDVTRWFPEMAVRSLTGRGIGLTTSHGGWDTRFFVGRTRGISSTTSWGAGIGKRIRPGLQAGVDILLLEEEAGRLGTQHSRLVCASAGVDSLLGWTVHTEGILSHRSLGNMRSFGGAAQLLADRDGPGWQVRTRAYAGSRDFAGRTRDRDGLSAFIRMTPWTSLRVWSSADLSGGRVGISSGAPIQRTARMRLGSRLSYSWLPSLEITAGHTRELEKTPGTIRDESREDITAALAKRTGLLYTSLTGRWGKADDLRSGEDGSMRGLEVSAGGRVKGVRAAMRHAVLREWSPHHGRDLRTSILSGDLSWGTRAGRLSAGLSVSSRSVDSGPAGNTMRREVQVRPRADLRISGNWSARIEASLLGYDEDPGLRRWQVQVSYSSPSVIPSPWVPTQGRLEVIAFVDEDMDGEMGPGERRIPGVLLNIETHQELTDAGGAARWQNLAPGTWWLELETGSLPMGLSPAVTFPMAVRVDPGRGSTLHIPLLRSGDVSGVVYLDDSHDGSLTEGERSLSEMRMVLLHGDRVVKESLTDRNGRYELHGVHPGTYRLRIADGWLPAGWVVTGPVEVEIQVRPAEEVRVKPYGIAPRRKPLIRTFVGEGPVAVSAAADSADSVRSRFREAPEAKPGPKPDTGQGDVPRPPDEEPGHPVEPEARRHHAMPETPRPTVSSAPKESVLFLPTPDSLLPMPAPPMISPAMEMETGKEESGPMSIPPIRPCSWAVMPAALKPGKGPEDFVEER